MQVPPWAVGTRSKAVILTRRAGKGNTKEMTFELRFENETDLSERESIPGQHVSRSKGLMACNWGFLKWL